MTEIRKIFIALAVAILMLPACGSRQVPAPSDSVVICQPGTPAEVMDADPDPGSASASMSVKQWAVAVDSIIANYDSGWNTLSMQGKLYFTGLPMRVNVKVFMECGKSIILSARAPLFGEVARVEANTDSIVFINKYTRCYNVQPLGALAKQRDVYLRDLQDILLGQVAYPGHGRMTPEMAALSQWIALPGAEAVIYPSSSFQIDGADYGFVMDSGSWELKTFVLMLKNAGVLIETKYLYGREGWTLGLDIDIKGKKMSGEVELSYPDYDVPPIEFTKIGGKFRKVDVKELLKF